MEPGRQQEGTAPVLPGHLPIPVETRLFYATSCATAFLVAVGAIWRLTEHPDQFSLPLLTAIPAGMLFADFVSGLIHWFADTWGSESMPILGKRLLHPFRVHHINPGDFLQRRFIDTNGDVAFLAIPFLLICCFMPLKTPFSYTAALFLTSSSSIGMLTNQIHQWAHMGRAPLLVRYLQNFGIILSHSAHQRHHNPPWIANYCITTGWCNRPLQAIQFFRRFERLITHVTGLQARSDEHQFGRSISGKQS